MALPPHWLDGAIQQAIDTGDAKAIASAIANSPDFIKAIERGLANRPKPGMAGPSHSQNIRREIQQAVS